MQLLVRTEFTQLTDVRKDIPNTNRARTKNIRLSQMHGGALAQKASKQKELSDHKLVQASNKRHGGGYSACALDVFPWLQDPIISNLHVNFEIK